MTLIQWQCYGQVTDVEFGGAQCSVAVALINTSGRADASNTPIRVRSSSIDLPPIGARVRITVLGKAHVFDHPPATQR